MIKSSRAGVALVILLSSSILWAQRVPAEGEDPNLARSGYKHDTQADATCLTCFSPTKNNSGIGTSRYRELQQDFSRRYNLKGLPAADIKDVLESAAKETAADKVRKDIDAINGTKVKKEEPTDMRDVVKEKMEEKTGGFSVRKSKGGVKLNYKKKFD